MADNETENAIQQAAEPTAPDSDSPEPADASSTSRSRMRAVAIALVAAALLIACVALGVAMCSDGGASSPYGDGVTEDASGHVVARDDREAARVGEETITEGQVTEAVLNYLKNAVGEDAAAWNSWFASQQVTGAQYRDQKLDELVEDTVVGLAAEQLGVVVTDEQAQAEYERNRSDYMERARNSTTLQLTDEELAERWTNAMLAQGCDEEQFRAYIKRLLLENAVADAVAAQGEDYQAWMTSFRASLGIRKQDAPNDLPYE